MIGAKFKDCFSSYVYGALTDKARKDFKTYWFDILVTSKKRLPYYRRDNPIYIAFPKQGGIRLHEENNQVNVDRFITLKLLPKVNNRVPETVFLLSNRSFDNSRTIIWERILQGEYKLCTVQLNYNKRKKKWFANISYSFEQDPEANLDQNIRLGVDLGIKVPVYLAIHGGQVRTGLYSEGETIENFRRQVESRRVKLRRNERKILERRQGRGRNHKIAPIEKLQEKIVNFRRTSNHRLSKAVVNFAVENGAGTIVMEDLKGFYEEHSEDKFLRNWTYHDLQSMIKYKAREKGIEVEKVNPRHTSQRCSK